MESQTTNKIASSYQSSFSSIQLDHSHQQHSNFRFLNYWHFVRFKNTNSLSYAKPTISKRGVTKIYHESTMMMFVQKCKDTI